MKEKMIVVTTLVLLLGLAGSASAELIGHWDFDEGSGTTAADTSGFFSDDGTGTDLNHDVTISGSTGSAGWTTGRIGGAYNFNRADGGLITDGHLLLNNNLNPADPNNQQVSIAFWAKANAPGDTQDFRRAFEAFGTDVHTRLNVFLPLDGSGNAAGLEFATFVAGEGFPDQLPLQVPDDYRDGVWHHWTFTKNRTTGIMQIFLDGRRRSVTVTDKTTAINNENFNGDAGVWIGSAIYGTHDFAFDGAIDDFRLYNHELTQAEILALVPDLSLGDFNDDGNVGAADYTVWRDNLGAPDESSLNGNGDGINGVDPGDYDLWRSGFGNAGAGGGAAATVPEPASFLLAVVAAVQLFVLRRRR